jgi:hypothetical protein
MWVRVSGHSRPIIGETVVKHDDAAVSDQFFGRAEIFETMIRRVSAIDTEEAERAILPGQSLEGRMSLNVDCWQEMIITKGSIHP